MMRKPNLLKDCSAVLPLMRRGGEVSVLIEASTTFMRINYAATAEKNMCGTSILQLINPGNQVKGIHNYSNQVFFAL